MKRIFLFSALVALAAGSQSCKKDKKKSDPDAKCRLTAFTDVTPGGGSSSTTSFSYNNDNKVSQITTSGTTIETKTFTYSGNTINIITKYGTTISSKEILTTNSAGNLIRSERRDVNNDTITGYTNYEYTSNGNLLKATDQYGSSTPTISNCVFTNGNLTSIGSSGSSTNLDYFSEQNFKIGDYLYLIQFIQYGRAFYIVNKNLVKSFESGGSIQNFDYTFDANNRITRLTLTQGASVSVIDIQQVCD